MGHALQSAVPVNRRKHTQPGHQSSLPGPVMLQVLRFYGYFQEAVTESNIENHRVRKVVLYYYLADDSIQVAEPKQDNSGIPQVCTDTSNTTRNNWIPI